jgi:hypothetical protein
MTKAQKRLLLAIGLIAAITVLPILNLAWLPLGYFYTSIHELCHALAAVVSGGKVHFLQVFADGSGVTQSAGANPLFVAPAGYVGAAIVAGLFVYAGKTERTARLALQITAWTLVLSSVLWLRGDLVGVLATVFWILLLFLAAYKAENEYVQLVVQSLGMALALASVRSVFSLVGLVSLEHQMNDAVILQEVSGIPAMLSACVWVLLNFTAVGLALKKSWN